MDLPPQAPPSAALLDAARRKGEADALPYLGALGPQHAYDLLRSNPAARLIDVRTRPEWDFVGHVPGAVLIEWNRYPGGGRNEGFLRELEAAVPDREAPVLFLCRSGQRSDSAARLAQEAGYTHAINVLEGFEGPRDEAGHRGAAGWRKAGLPWIQG